MLPSPRTPWAPPQALGLAIASLVCWGSWSNTAKAATNAGLPFAYFYIDYALGVMVLGWGAYAGLAGGSRLRACEPPGSIN